MDPAPAVIRYQSDGCPTHGGLVIIAPSRIADPADIAGTPTGLEDLLHHADPVGAAITDAELVVHATVPSGPYAHLSRRAPAPQKSITQYIVAIFIANFGSKSKRAFALEAVSSF